MNTRSAVVALMAGLVLLLGTGSALATPLTRAAVAAEQQFGGQVFAAELYREDGKRLVEVELLSGGQIVEVVLNADSGRFLESDTYGSQRRVGRAMAALDVAQISLSQAIRAARGAVGRGQILEAELLVAGNQNTNGKRYIVDIRNQQGEFEVIVNSRDGRVMRIVRD